MAAFDRGAFITHELDFRVAVDGPAALFWSPTFLSETERLRLMGTPVEEPGPDVAARVGARWMRMLV